MMLFFSNLFKFNLSKDKPKPYVMLTEMYLTKAGAVDFKFTKFDSKNREVGWERFRLTTDALKECGAMDLTKLPAQFIERAKQGCAEII